jgi:Rap1a immunity proteins
MKIAWRGTLLLLVSLATNANTRAEEGIHASTVETAVLAYACEEFVAKGSLDTSVCTGYLLGAFDQMSFSRVICPADGFASQQAVTIGRKYLKDHPNKWHLHPAVLLREAFSNAFPCRH